MFNAFVALLTGDTDGCPSRTPSDDERVFCCGSRRVLIEFAGEGKSELLERLVELLGILLLCIEQRDLLYNGLQRLDCLFDVPELTKQANLGRCWHVDAVRVR